MTDKGKDEEPFEMFKECRKTNRIPVNLNDRGVDGNANETLKTITKEMKDVAAIRITTKIQRKNMTTQERKERTARGVP